MSCFSRQLFLLAAFAILWTLPNAAEAQLPWQTPTTVSETTGASEQARTAIAADGTVIVVWRKLVGGDGVIQTRTRPPGGDFGPIEQLSASGGDARYPRVAFTPGGEAIVTWARHNGHNLILQVRSRPAAGSFGPVTDLSPTGNNAFFPDIAAGSDGTVAIAWTNSGATNIPLVAIRPPGGAFGQAEPLIGAGEFGKDPSVVVRQDGAVVIVWLRRTASLGEPHPPGGYYFRAQSSMKMPGEDFRLAGYVSKATQNVDAVDVAAGENGFVAANYSAQEWATGTYQVEVAPLKTGTIFGDGLFAGSEIVATSDGTITRPGLTIGPDGETNAFWLRHQGSASRLLQVRSAPQGGAFTAATSLSTPGAEAVNPLMSTGSEGTTSAIWAEDAGSGYIIRSRSKPSGATFGAPTDLGTSPSFTYAPAISVGPFGMATGVWSEAQGPNVIIRSASTPRPKFGLDVNASGTGQGRVISAPAGIDCTATCQADFDAGSTVTLQAVPAAGSGFVGWGGDCSGQDATCDVAIDRARTVVAEFSGSPWVLPAKRISDESNVTNPRAASGSKGEFAVVWQADSGASIQIQINHSRPGRGFTGTEVLSPVDANSVDPDVALGRANEVVVVWRQFVEDSFVIFARTRGAHGDFGPAKQLSPNGRTATAPRVATGPEGEITVTWFETFATGQKLVARAGQVDGTFGPVVDVSEVGQMAFAPLIGTDGQGNTTFGWVQSDGSNLTVRTRTLTSGGVLSPVSELSQTGRNATVPRLAVGPEGGRAITWLRSDGSDPIAQGSVAPADSSFGPTLNVSNPGAAAKTPTVAIEASGDATFAWILDKGDKHLLQTRTIGTSTGPVEHVHETPERLELPELRTGPNGSAVLLARKRDGSEWQIIASLRSGGEAFEPVVSLAEDDNPQSILAAFSPFGRVIAAWSTLDGAGRGLESASTAPESRKLSVLKSGVTTGLLRSEPEGILCGETCSAEFERGTVVTLFAEPGPNSMLTSWGDLCLGSAPSCETTLDQVREAEITFTRTYELTASVAGAGTGLISSSPEGINCASVCSSGFAADTVVTLSAIADPGMSFSGWNGACSGQSPTCQVTVDRAMGVTATFAPVPGATHELTVHLTGNGAGRVTSAPAGIDCSASCEHSFEEGSALTLTAIPDQGSRFSGWSGPCQSSGSICQVTVNQAMNVTAEFTLDNANVCPPRELDTGTVKLNRQKGTALLMVVSGGPGRVILQSSGQVRQSNTTTDRAGRGNLLIRPRGKAVRKLKKTGKATLRVKLTYKPGSGCRGVTRTHAITLRKNR